MSGAGRPKRPGRVLGLDYGSKRVGAALSDSDRSLASPLEVYERKSRPTDAQHYRRLVEEHGVDRIVVGLPVHASGREGGTADLARAWGRWVGEETGCPVFFIDERYTSIEAEESMRAAGLRASQRKGKIDMLAARSLLQAYLDAGCPDRDAEPDALDDRR